MNRIAIKPELVQWARERAGVEVATLVARFPKLPEWERGEAQPTFKQLEDFAKATHVPFGYMFLPEPPQVSMPIPDFRVLQHQHVDSVSPNLLDTIYTMQRRQAWLRESRLECEAAPLEFVGSARLSDDPAAIGREMRRLLGLSDGWVARVRTWQEAVGYLRSAIEEVGVMAVINGIVGNNQNTRVGALFATQVIYAAREGRIGFKQAYELTGLNGGTFQEYAFFMLRTLRVQFN